MPLSVNSAFAEFNANVVNLVSDRTNAARASRGWLFDKLNQLPAIEKNFPFHFPEMNIHYGSFSRNTKIRELDDVDLIFALHGNQAFYEKQLFSNTYTQCWRTFKNFV
jgi:hypothetical protein